MQDVYTLLIYDVDYAVEIDVEISCVCSTLDNSLIFGTFRHGTGKSQMTDVDITSNWFDIVLSYAMFTM